MPGRKTHEQQLKIINRQENTKGSDAPSPGTSLDEAKGRQKRPATAYDNASGDRRIVRGDSQEDQHHKRRQDD